MKAARRAVRRKELRSKVRNFPWVVGALLVLLFVGGIGFWLGVGAAPASVPVAATAAGTPVVYAGGWHFGFPFGFFIFLFFMFVIFGIVRRAAWGGGRGPRGYGYRWSGKDVPPVADEMLDRWHARAHRPPPPPEDPSSLRIPDDPS
jgi:hypothetical protein